MSGFLALLTVLAGFLVWLAQRRLELKMRIFNDAVKALIAFEVDVGNQELQNDNYETIRNGKPIRRFYPYLRDEISALTQCCTSLVNAFFSKDISSAFDKAINSVELICGEDGKPMPIGLYDLDERKAIINGLCKELSISFMFKKWFCRLVGFHRLNK